MSRAAIGGEAAVAASEGGSLQWEPSIAIAIACYKPKPEKISPLANDKEPKSVSAMTKLRMLRNLKGGFSPSSD